LVEPASFLRSRQASFFSFLASALLGSALALSEIESAFFGYITQFGKSYSTMEEYELRLRQFAVKHAFIQEHNAEEGHTYKAGHNMMSDWTQEEYEAMLTYKPDTTE
jgi:hypothetical protein